MYSDPKGQLEISGKLASKFSVYMDNGVLI